MISSKGQGEGEHEAELVGECDVQKNKNINIKVTKNMIDTYLLEKIKSVSLPSLLAHFGVHPVKGWSHGKRYYLYLAAYRHERHPSLSVFYHDGKWLFHDFATGETGTNIDMLVRFNFFHDWREAASFVAKNFLGCELSEDNASPREDNSIAIRTENSYPGVIHSISRINKDYVAKYLESRGIPLSVASKYVYIATYSYPPSEKRFFGLAWKTRKGGWSIRWPLDLPKGKGKTFVGPAGITVFPADIGTSDSCLVFEGIFDFLSYVLMAGGTINMDAIVLNSVCNVSEACDVLSNYDDINCYLDNDQPGVEATTVIAKRFPGKVRDMSNLYKHSNCIDLNDYLLFVQKYN